MVSSKIYNRRIFALSLAFTLLLILFEATIFGQYRAAGIENFAHVWNADYRWKYLILDFGSWLFSIAAFFAFVYISLISPLGVRIFCLIIFALITAVEYAYQNVYGRFLIMPDLKVAFLTNSAQRLDAVSSYISWLALIPALAYLILLAATFAKTGKFTYGKSLAALAVVLLTMFGFYLSLFFAAPKFFSYLLYQNSFSESSRVISGYTFWKIASSPVPRAQVAVPPDQPKPVNNIVFIIDESTRGDHLSINGYERSTTPYLESLKQQNLLTNWGIAASGSTRSLESFQYLAVGITPDESDGIGKKIQQMPTIFQYAKAAGYKTFYIDGQLNDYWGGYPDDLKAIDEMDGVETFNADGQPAYDVDFKIARKVNEIITTSTGNFIFVFKRGYHTPYIKNFAPENAVWLPVSNDIPPFESPDFNRQTLVNAYDDGIKYNLDKFFQILVPDQKVPPNNTVIFYTGDHGQTLSDHDERYPHGGKTVHEATVPLFMIGDAKTKIDTDFRASHSNIFPTLLDLMNYPSDLRKFNYAISLFKATGADSKERYFLSPNDVFEERVVDKGMKIKFD